jgi:phosphate-selective porin OprO and OprP
MDIKRRVTLVAALSAAVMCHFVVASAEPVSDPLLEPLPPLNELSLRDPAEAASESVFLASTTEELLPPAPLTTEQRLAELEGAVAGLRAALEQQSSAAVSAIECPEPEEEEGPSYPNSRLSGFMQIDAGWFNQDATSFAEFGDIQDTRGFRRARLAAVGEVTEETIYNFEVDFAFPGRPSFMDVWLEQKGVPIVENVRIGHFRQYFGMTELSSVRELTFLERPLPFAMTIMRQIGIGSRNAYWDENVTWGYSGFGFPSDQFGDVQGDRGYGVASRLTAVPWSNADDSRLFHVGADYALALPVDNLLRYRSTPEFGGTFVGINGNVGSIPPFVDTGVLDARKTQLLNGELAGTFGPLHATSEARYAVVDLVDGEQVTFPGAYIETGYILTGEHRPYKRDVGTLGRIVPDCPVGKGGAGAWEVAARYSYIDLNPGGIGGGRLSDATLGLNWYLNKYTKLQLNYIRAMLDRPPFGDSDTNIVAVRAQLDW